MLKRLRQHFVDSVRLSLSNLVPPPRPRCQDRDMTDWRYSGTDSPTDPPAGYTVHHAVVTPRGRERVLLLCQTGQHVALVSGVDVAELEPGVVVLVSLRTDAAGSPDETAWVRLGEAWHVGRIEWAPKRRPVLVVPSP